jgi:ornithine cyclodeaminase
VLRAAKVFVEYEPQTRIEGDLQHLPADFEVTELWQVLSGQQTGRDDDSQVTVFDSVGFALEDFSALRYVYEQALHIGLGIDLDLIPALDDPKDLYQLIRPSAATRTTPTSHYGQALVNSTPLKKEAHAVPEWA